VHPIKLAKWTLGHVCFCWILVHPTMPRLIWSLKLESGISINDIKHLQNEPIFFHKNRITMLEQIQGGLKGKK